MNLDTWLAAITADARQRGLSELPPLLEAMVRSTQALREADDARRLRAEADRPSEPQDR